MLNNWHKCCGKRTQSNFRFCPHCGRPNLLFEGLKRPAHFPYEGMHADDLSRTAVKTSEFRAPRKGEYFLSGALPIAYLAYNDMSTRYRIMRLVARDSLPGRG